MGTTWIFRMVNNTSHITIHTTLGLHPKKKTRKILDTVPFPHRKFNMPKMSSSDATIHAAHGLIHEIKNLDPASSLVTL